MSEVVLLAGAEIHFHTVYAQLAFNSFARADRFDHVVQEAFRQLAAYPHSAPEFVGKYRRLLLGDFPSLFITSSKGKGFSFMRFLISASHPNQFAGSLVADRLDVSLLSESSLS